MKRNRIWKKQQTGSLAIVDLTPMIDIVFILIVFLILTANVAQNIFDLELPKSDENYQNENLAKAIKEEKLTLFANGKFAKGEEVYQSLGVFKQAVLIDYKKDPNVRFLIITESTLSVETLMEFLTFLKANNITQIDILLKK